MTRSPTPTPTLVVAAIPPPAEREEEEDGGERVGWYLLGFDATYHVRDEGRYTRRPATVARMRTSDGGGGGAEVGHQQIRNVSKILNTSFVNP